MRCLFLALLWGLSTSAPAQDVTVCYNYGCTVKAQVAFDTAAIRWLEAYFDKLESGVAERGAIREAVGFMSRIAGQQTPIYNDKGRNNFDDDLEGRMDCLDHSATTTAYLKFLESYGLLRYHRVLEPAHRAPYLVNDHWSARIEDTQTGEQFAVDTWFLDHGAPASIFPMQEWLRGAEPRG